jgi:hypothetical protein
MAQRAFDHCFNTLADPTYADRCQRKRKLRQRKSPTGNYQIDEDVWARHPTDGFVYIASVIAIDSLNRTCRVVFVNDDQPFDLAFSQLRHVTREDIRCNRYVDYGHGWSDDTKPGIIITYDRYGELESTEYTGITQDAVNDFVMTEEYQFVENDRTNHILSSNSETENEDITLSSLNESTNEQTSTDTEYITSNALQSEALRRLLPIFLEEMDTSQLLAIWPDLDVNLIEELRRQSFPSESSASEDDSALVVNEQPLLSHEVRRNQPDIIAQAIELSAPFQVRNAAQADKSSQELFDQHFILDRSQDENLQSAVVPMASINLLVSKEVGTQTESFTSLSMVSIDRSSSSIDELPLDQPTEYCRTSELSKKTSTNRWPLNYDWLIQENITSTVPTVIEKRHRFPTTFPFEKPLSSGFTKSRPSVLLAIVIAYCLLIGSIFQETNANFEKLKMASINLIRQNAMPFVFYSGLIWSYMVNGPGKSPPPLWWYALAVP